jgi:hypothetical protein
MTPEISEATVQDLTDRLARSRVSHSPHKGWQLGTPTAWLEELILDSARCGDPSGEYG